MPMISVAEAAERKGVSRSAMWRAVTNGEVNGEQIGRSWAVKVDRKFEAWQPSGRVRSGRARWQKAKVRA